MRHDNIKLKIEKNIPLPIHGQPKVRYVRIYEMAFKMKESDSVLFKDYYHAAALSKYLKDLKFQAPIRVVRDEKGERMGWRVWAVRK